MLLAFAIQASRHPRHRQGADDRRPGLVITLFIVGIVPFFNGNFHAENFTPFVPVTGAWDNVGWTFVLGGMFIAAWSTYGFETAICYTSEFKDPRPTPSRRSSIPACCASPCSSWCRSPSRAISASTACGGAHPRRQRRGGRLGRDGDRRQLVFDIPVPVPDDRSLDPDHRHGDGGLLAHALSGLGRRLAAALSLGRQSQRRADRRGCGRTWCSTCSCSRSRRLT